MATKYDKLEQKIEDLEKKHYREIENLEEKYITRREMSPVIRIFQAIVIALAVGLATALLNVVLK